MPHDLIPITKFPSIPAPLNSSDCGESFVWGDFVLILQKNPISLAEWIQKQTSKKDFGIPPLEYPFAMSVFYRLDKNPQGPSKRPILVATLERMNYSKVAEVMKRLGKPIPEAKGNDAPTICGIFDATKHKSIGEFDGEVTAESAKQYFFEVIARHLELSGEPRKIGVIKDIYGHPDTGWPEDKASTTSKEATSKNKNGCLPLAAILAIITFSIFFGFLI